MVQWRACKATGLRSLAPIYPHLGSESDTNNNNNCNQRETLNISVTKNVVEQFF